MSYRLAKSLEKLRSQINAANPTRDKSSDGWIGDTSHKARKSDHNPNAAGVVTAIDVDRDLAPGRDARVIVTALQHSGDRRIKYLIFDRQITVKGDITKWQPYHGPSPHDHHFHISVSSDPNLYDDASDWNISAVGASPVSDPSGSHPTNKGEEAQAASGNSATAQPPIMKVGSKGRDVAIMQTALTKLGYRFDPDGVFGPNTEKAVRAFQKKKGLTVDGMVGPNTRMALGIKVR
jgi:murein L,D-transpeptidase YcbB/YkuD